MPQGRGRGSRGRQRANGRAPARSYAWRTGRKLAEFIRSAGRLKRGQKKTIVEQALVLFGENYVHLPAKRARYSVDPVQRLKLMLQTLENGSATDSPGLGTGGDETAFHREVTDVFMSVRDRHMQYLLPKPFKRATAFLPFLVEAYWKRTGTNRTRTYIVAHLANGFRAGSFKPGVEITHWNGTPIARAVANNAELFGGGNSDARHARGLHALTVRPLITARPPEEDWIVVRYRTAGGERREIMFDWHVSISRTDVRTAEAGADGADRGLDLEQHLTRTLHRKLFRPPQRMHASRLPDNRETDLWTRFKHQFSACRIKLANRRQLGYFRIWSFFPPDGVVVEDFVAEFVRLLKQMPSAGLILDVRSNAGGSINCAERILQTLTPRTIEPELFQFINTPLNLKICRKNVVREVHQDLTPWTASMKQSLQTGAVYSAGFPISQPVPCNEIGQKYFGPVVLITDALSYSSTDILSAGFADHGIGTVLGVDASTGGGGANVWYHSDVRHTFPLSDPANPYRALPNEADMRVSIRRSLRVGPNAGALLEDVGVAATKRYFMTRNDLLDHNFDLIETAGRLLARRKVRTFDLKEVRGPAGKTKLKVQVTGMTRLDPYLNERPYASVKPDGQGVAIIEVDDATAVEDFVEIRGFDGNNLVARVRFPERL